MTPYMDVMRKIHRDATRTAWTIAVFVVVFLLMVGFAAWVMRPSEEEQKRSDEARAAQEWLDSSDDPGAREYRAREAARRAIEQEKMFQKWRDDNTRRDAIENPR